MRAPLLCCLILGLVTASFGAEAEQGVSGLAVHGGKPVPGATVAAWKTLDDFGKRRPPLAVSLVTGEDGLYRLPLPAGEYYVAAGKGTGWGKRLLPESGDLYCFFGNNPVSVSARQWLSVGFNMIKVPAEPKQEKAAAGIGGTLIFEGAPLEKAYVVAYRPDQPRFRGPGHAFAPVGKGGAFQLRLAPGTYYLVARKRQQGALSGPLSHGDQVGFYHANPVVIGVGERRTITIEMVQRLDNLDGTEAGGPGGTAGGAVRPEMAMGYSGRVVDATKRPKPGLRVMAYEAGSEGTGTPLFISEPTDAEGKFTLPIPRPGQFLLIAREKTGGKPGEGEWFGKAQGAALTVARMKEEIEIKVSPVPKEGDR